MELLRIDLSGIANMKVATEAMIARALDLRPVFEVMHQAWTVEMIEQFATEGSYYMGEQWAPLSPEYAKRKMRKYGPMPILIATGALVKSLIGEGGEHVKQIGPDHAVFGTSVPYAQYHQGGTGKMPKRQIIKVTDQLARVGYDSAMKYITTGKAERG